PNTWGMHKILGPVMARYDNWSDPEKRKLVWTFEVPSMATDWNSDYAHSYTIAGDYVFVVGNVGGQPFARMWSYHTGREITSK
ncbi:MAG: hypothetical protein N3A66_07830, partial [Planctomycetota bacterium]|nr:hypothetical protein [Planctomycetota bacterium]